ncbi:CGNR zinc finger domain-containing protein [Streptomyces sp. NPDC041068]|uniref:CGNR zinc finger domain-containing protein n=1 Tax=Streptomyces sp. NPDC041068 TaxID=3155130 RepID=UPI0033FA0754
MHFNHYGGEAALLAAELVNSLAEAPPLSPLLASHGVVDHALTDAQEADLRAWAALLAACFGPQELERRCDTVNALLAQASSSPRISLHDGRPHFHYSAPAADPAAHVRALTAAGLAYVVCFADAQRLGRCARDGCGIAYVDTSRNGRRTYCSVRCANNDAVARHRSRGRG